MPTAHKLLYVRQGLKGAAMFLFERAKAAKGKNREPGLQATSARGIFSLKKLFGVRFTEKSR